MSETDTFGVDDIAASTTFRDVPALCQRWQEARKSRILPDFEDVAIGNLRHVADDLAVFGFEASDRVVAQRMGPAFRRQIGSEHDCMALDALPANYRIPLEQAIRASIVQSRPIFTTARCIADGSVGICEFIALPLRSRWNDILVLGFLKQRPVTYDLVDAIYQATADGLLALAPIACGTTSTDFQIISLNAGAGILLRKSEQDLCWTLLSDHLVDQDDRKLLDLLADALRSQVPQHFDYGLTTDTGRLYLQISAAPIGDLLAIAMTDVTKIRKREESVRQLFEGNPMPLLVYDPANFQIVEANGAYLALSGYEPGELRRMTLLSLHPESEHKQLTAGDRGSTPGEVYRELRHRRADGRLLDVLVYSRELFYDDRACVLASIVDVTEKRQAEARIAYLAHHDPMTDLANRTLLKRALSASLARIGDDHGLVAVHCIDLDHFKRVNDAFGHSTGDALLVAASVRLKGIVRQSDLIARLGGDEFAIVQTGAGKAEDVDALAGRVIEALSAPYVIDGQSLSIGASIGVAVASAEIDSDDLLKNADIALYRAKAQGRGTFALFRPEMNEALQSRRLLEADLRNALLQGEFALAFQPFVDLASGITVGCEALLRWRHPERGTVPPLQFIGLAEEIGLIIPIGAWVLHQSCLEAVTWPTHVNVAVNLSPVQFASPSLIPTIADALSFSGLAPHRLELEITESVLLADTATNLATVRRLRAMGVSISMDDFGTGYSSLGYLRSFPFDKIKIDRSFVTDMAENAGSRAIVRAVMGLASDLGIKTLAEGIETTEQLRMLRAEGCGQAQGYLFSPPVPREVLSRLLVRNPQTETIAA